MVALVVTTVCFSQYTVTKVIGRVTNKTSGEVLRPGSKLRDTDLLGFSKNTDMVRVIVSGKGVYVISPGPHSETQDDLIVDMLKSALKIKSKEGYLSGRSPQDEMIPAVLKTEAAVNESNLFGAENKYIFDQRMYNTSGGNRFFLQAEIAGAKPVIVPLKTVSDTLLIYAADFGNSAATYKLGFYSQDTKKSQLLADLKPQIDTTSEMEAIVKVLVQESDPKDKDQLQRKVYAEVYEALGKPPAVSFNQVYSKVLAESAKEK